MDQDQIFLTDQFFYAIQTGNLIFSVICPFSPLGLALLINWLFQDLSGSTLIHSSGFIDLNAEDVNGMTPFDLTVHSGKLMFGK